MTKIGGVKRDGLFTRELSGDRPYFVFEISKRRYQQGGRAPGGVRLLRDTIVEARLITWSEN